MTTTTTTTAAAAAAAAARFLPRSLHNMWSSTLSLNSMGGSGLTFGGGPAFRRSKSVRSLYEGGMMMLDGGMGSEMDDEELLLRRGRGQQQHGQQQQQQGQGQQGQGRRLRRVVLLRRSADLGAGLGFSIRGGRELGLGIFVSKVVERSVADRAGLVPGDQIVAVNDTSFEDISHEEAIKILKSAPRLALVVCSTGRVPGSCVVHQTYTWLDSEGRTVSPPPEYDHSFYSSPAHRKAVSRLHNTPRIRKVTIRVEKGQSLGLMIRGGVEYGLGIYITGVDKNSVADLVNLKIGDQILEVNNQSFLDITHDEAVRVLKYSPHMVMTIREVGKVPYSCTTYDEAGWLATPKDGAPGTANSATAVAGRSPRLLRKGDESSLLLLPNRENLVHTIDMQALRILNEKAKLVLNKHDLATLSYYRIEYERGRMTIDAFVAVLLELFETEEKYALLQDIREVIHPMDLHKFDELIYKKDLEMARTRQSLGADDRSSRNRFSSVSMDHLTSHVANSHSPRTARRLESTRYGPGHPPDTNEYYPTDVMSCQDGGRRAMSRVGRRRGTSGVVSNYHSTNNPYVTAGGEYITNTTCNTTTLGPGLHDDDIHTPSEDSGVDLANGSYYGSNRGAMMSNNKESSSSGRVISDPWHMNGGGERPLYHHHQQQQQQQQQQHQHQQQQQHYQQQQHHHAPEESHLSRRGTCRRHPETMDGALDDHHPVPHPRRRSTERRWSVGSDRSEALPPEEQAWNSEPAQRYPKWKAGRSSNRYGSPGRSSSLPRN